MALTEISNLSSHYYTTCRPSTTIMAVVILCVGEIETTFIVKQGSKYSNQTLIFAKVYINKCPFNFVCMCVIYVRIIIYCIFQGGRNEISKFCKSRATSRSISCDKESYTNAITPTTSSISSSTTTSTTPYPTTSTSATSSPTTSPPTTSSSATSTSITYKSSAMAA